MRKRITKRSLDALRPGESIADDEVRGFLARRLPSGVITFGYRYSDQTTGKRRWLPLGLFGRLTAEEARKLAQKAAGEAAMGQDPVEQRKNARTKANGVDLDKTLNSLLDRFLDEYVDEQKLRTKDEIRRAIDFWVRPAIGKILISNISRKDILSMCDHITREVSSRRADLILAYVRKAFNWYAIFGDQDFKSPIVSGMARVKSNDLKRSRHLSEAELCDVWQALELVHPVYAGVVRGLLFSAVRLREFAEISYEEIDAKAIVVPAERMKAKLPHAIPITPQIRKILNDRLENRRKPKGAKFVFWARKGGKRPFQGWSTQKVLLDQKIAQIRKARDAQPMPAWRLHDLRRTSRTLMSQAGVDADIAERILAHKMPGVRSVYDVYEYFEEKRKGLLKLEKRILQIVDSSLTVPGDSSDAPDKT
jgi:integrase